MSRAKVSIWAAKFDDEAQMREYLNTDYNDDGDLIASKFMRNFNIGDYDEDFLETEFYGKRHKSLCEMAETFSYAECFLDQISDIKSDKNCIIAIYDFSYDGQVKSDENAKFLGVFDYEF